MTKRKLNYRLIDKIKGVSNVTVSIRLLTMDDRLNCSIVDTVEMDNKWEDYKKEFRDY